MGFILYVKSVKGYKKIFQTPGFDICTIMSGGEINPSLKSFIDQMSADKPLFRECPYEGRIEILNLAMKGEGAFGIYPQGMYQISVTFSRKKNKVDLAMITAIFAYKMGKSG